MSRKKPPTEAMDMVSSRTMHEKTRQEGYHWNRSAEFATYNSVLGYYQAQACLECAHGPALLDLACGDGSITAVLAEHFQRVVAVDASARQLAEAKQRLLNAEFHECLIEDLSTDEKFDTVTMLNILEHVPDARATLKRAASTLQKDGVLIVQVPNEEAINRRIALAMGTIKSLGELSPFDINIAGHRRSYSMDSLIRETQDAGLEVKTTGGVFYKQLSMAQMDWFLSQGLWKEGGFGWGRVGEEESRDWRAEFCRACYEVGRHHPRECNVIYVVATR